MALTEGQGYSHNTRQAKRFLSSLIIPFSIDEHELRPDDRLNDSVYDMVSTCDWLAGEETSHVTVGTVVGPVSGKDFVLRRVQYEQTFPPQWRHFLLVSMQSSIFVLHHACEMFKHNKFVNYVYNSE